MSAVGFTSRFLDLHGIRTRYLEADSPAASRRRGYIRVPERLGRQAQLLQ
jgi:hypothetical protein